MANTKTKTAKVIQLGQRQISYEEKLVFLYQELNLINEGLNANLNTMDTNIDRRPIKKYSFNWLNRILGYITKKTI